MHQKLRSVEIYRDFIILTSKFIIIIIELESRNGECLQDNIK